MTEVTRAASSARDAGTDPADGGAPFPLTDLQAGYLVGASRLIELGGFRPNLYTELDVVGFDPARAEHAINLLIRRHEHLRTVVLADGRQQVIGEERVTPVRIPVVDVSGLSPADREQAILATRERMLDEGPDPTGWPLLDIVVHRVRPHRHRVHFAMSLLLLDSASTFTLQRELLLLYRDPGAELPPVRRTFRECVLARMAREDSDAYREQWRYWEDRLDSLPGPPQPPLARRPAGVSPVRLTRRACVLTADQWNRLRANFRRRRVLPTTGLLHVFAETLGAWSATPRFSLNVLHQNWALQDPDVEGVVGQFSATLPLEVDLTADEDFWARARTLQSRLWRDLKNSEVTGVRITRELAARRGWTSGAAMPYVFNSMLASGEHAPLATRPACRRITTGLRTPQVLIDNQVLDDVDGGVACVWDVVDDVYPPGLPDIMFDAYRTMLETLSGPDGHETAPDPVPAGHRALVASLNVPRTPPGGRLEDGFLRNARAHPDAVAVITSERRLTYGRVDDASRAVAAWLGERGVGPGDVVPVVMAKGWEQIVAVLGVLRAGAAYCPVDAGLPAERIRHLIRECSARAVLGQSHRPLAEPPGVPVLHVDTSHAGAPSEGAGRPAAVRAGGEDPAYVIHTSGSTGRPKGVVIEHRAALNTIHEVNRLIGLGPADRVFGISSLSFDLSVWDVFGALTAGAAVILPEATPRPDPMGWAATARACGATVWNSVPALAEMLAEVVEERAGLGRPPVRAFLLSGDWVPTSLPDRLRRLWPRTRVVAMGGATEASIWSNVYEIGRVDPSWRSIPYGTPLRGQTMEILDHRLDVRAPWAVGRIYIGGAGLARGYAGDEQRTAERFVRHPRTGERLYWTGDLGRYLPGGIIEFLGREDRQLKIHGFRVEPGEIESAIREHPGVRECAVGAVSGAGGRPRLVAFAVPHAGRAPDAAAITARLRDRLPSYMVPGQIHVLNRLPLTSNGKVDVSRALTMVATPPRTGRTTDAPEDTLTRRLTELWEEILQAPGAGPDGDFFALGGNSLLALRLINRIRAEVGGDPQFGLIFEAPTARALAIRIRDGGAGGCAVTLAAGTGTELFLFHPVGGSVRAYHALAQAWPGPVRAFQSRALVHGQAAVPEPGLPAMAAAYCDELRRLAPRGPYVLGGWSMGGVLAYEVARLLAETGERTDVFMIDSMADGDRSPDTDVARHHEFLRDLAGGRLPGAVTAVLRDADPAGLTRAARDAAVEHGLLPVEIDVPAFERLMRTHTHNLTILAAHRPDTSDRRTLLFVAGDVDRPDPAVAWRAVCAGIEVEVLPADHYSIVADDRIPGIVDRVTAWLAEPTAGRTAAE
ncbi:amino acid adenylation domain-containing protein [Streptosporangium sp. NPDC048865]|uniref:non-ribosomal peptide synthetase n=1 Tax=Streptosporangium sp. NPDC048865 TaxID=3155766 RepID=UPI0034198A84